MHHLPGQEQQSPPAPGAPARARDAAAGPASVAPDPHRFVLDVEPLLAEQDTGGLLRLLKSRYRGPEICFLLNGPHPDARKLAALCLALVGDNDAIAPLVSHLRDADPMVNEMAEHALWSIWFRGGTPEANALLVRGTQYLNERRTEDALRHFTAAIGVCAGFAEAYNQRGMVLYLQERFDEALPDCRRAAELMPCHFGAWACRGHCHVHRGEFEAALDCYRRALAINPHLQCVAEMVEALEARHAAGEDVEEWTEGWKPRNPSDPCG